MSDFSLFDDELTTIAPQALPLSERPRSTTTGHAVAAADPLDGCTVVDCWLRRDSLAAESGIPTLVRVAGDGKIYSPIKFAFWDSFEEFDAGFGRRVIRHKVNTTHVYTALGAMSAAGGRILE